MADFGEPERDSQALTKFPQYSPDNPRLPSFIEHNETIPPDLIKALQDLGREIEKYQQEIADRITPPQDAINMLLEAHPISKADEPLVSSVGIATPHINKVYPGVMEQETIDGLPAKPPPFGEQPLQSTVKEWLEEINKSGKVLDALIRPDQVEIKAPGLVDLLDPENRFSNQILDNAQETLDNAWLERMHEITSEY